MTDTLEIPELGSFWEHRNGNIYEVYDVTNQDTQRPDEYPVSISYKNVLTGAKYSRSLVLWYKSNSLTRLKLGSISNQFYLAIQFYLALDDTFYPHQEAKLKPFLNKPLTVVNLPTLPVPCVVKEFKREQDRCLLTLTSAYEY